MAKFNIRRIIDFFVFQVLPSDFKKAKLYFFASKKRKEHTCGNTVSSLDLSLIGNCSFGALIDAKSNVVWMCLPRFDSNPVFISLLSDKPALEGNGVFAIEMLGFERSEQEYLENTAIVQTRLYDRHGSGILTPWLRSVENLKLTDCSKIFSPVEITMACCLKISTRIHTSFGVISPRLTVWWVSSIQPCGLSKPWEEAF